MVVLLESAKVRLRPLRAEDVSGRYVAWLNDPEVNRYLESRFELQTLEGCRRYVAEIESHPDKHLFGIFDPSCDLHVGNIKIEIVSRRHRIGEVGLLIGERDSWGRGLGTEAIELLTRWCFEVLGLEKLEAGCYEQNLGSVRAFLKCGYGVEGYRRRSFDLDGRRVGAFRLGITRSDLG